MGMWRAKKLTVQHTLQYHGRLPCTLMRSACTRMPSDLPPVAYHMLLLRLHACNPRCCQQLGWGKFFKHDASQEEVCWPAIVCWPSWRRAHSSLRTMRVLADERVRMSWVTLKVC